MFQPPAELHLSNPLPSPSPQFDEQPAMEADSQTDNRQWTQQHLDAADLRIPSIAPTPPQGEIENDCLDVNVRGPGGSQSLHNSYVKGILCASGCGANLGYFYCG